MYNLAPLSKICKLDLLSASIKFKIILYFTDIMRLVKSKPFTFLISR